MKRNVAYAVAFSLLSFLLTLPAGWAQATAPGVLVIEGGTLIDGNGGQPVRDSVIVIRGNKIETVGRKGQVTPPAGATVLKADGKFIVPGLMDAHVHYADYMGELMLNHGVTSVFEIGGGQEVGIAMRRAIDRGKVVGPRVFLAVGSLAGGEIAAVQGRTGLESPLSGRQVVMTADKAREVSKRFIEAGADMIKVHRGPPAEVYQAAFEEAHKAGLPAVAQPLGPTVYAREAAMTGVDILEHAAGVEYSVAKDPAKWKSWGSIEAHSVDPSAWSDMDDAKAADMIQLLIQKKVALEPDIICRARGVFNSSEERDRYELQDYQLLSNLSLAYIPEDRRMKWLRNYHEFDNMDPKVAQVRRQGLLNLERFISQFAKAGGKVLTGTDTSGWAVPGIGLHHEFNILVEAGLTPMQVIMASTRNVAEAFRILNRLGTIEAGKLADVVVVNDDPLKDINNLQKIEWVIKDGGLVNRTYNRWYHTPFQGAGVEGLSWAVALKKQSLQKDPSWAFGWPPVGIEGLSPLVVTEGDPTQTITLKGVNFTLASVVYVNDEPVTTKFISDSELKATLDKALLARAATLTIVVKHPQPLQRPEWGKGISNEALLLVDYRYDEKE